MKWKTKTDKPKAWSQGERVEIERFAFLPVKCADGYTYWLETICYIYECNIYNTTFDPLFCERINLQYWRLITNFPAYETNTD